MQTFAEYNESLGDIQGMMKDLAQKHGYDGGTDGMGGGMKGNIAARAPIADKAKSYVWLLVPDGGDVEVLGGEAGMHTSRSPMWGRSLMHCTSLDMEYIAGFCGLLDIMSASRTFWSAEDAEALGKIDTEGETVISIRPVAPFSAQITAWCLTTPRCLSAPQLLQRGSGPRW
jgi:hypothetical protein